MASTGRAGPGQPVRLLTNGSTSDVWRFPKAGGQRELVATVTGKVMSSGFAVDDRQIYVGTEETPTTEATVVAVGKAVGSAPTALAPIADSMPAYLAVDTGYVYWTNDRDGSVWRVAKSGGTPVPLFTGLTELRYFVVVGDTVYFAQCMNALQPSRCTSGGIRKGSRLGGPVTTLTEGGNGYWRIAVDDTMVYFTNQMNGTVNAVAR